LWLNNKIALFLLLSDFGHGGKCDEKNLKNDDGWLRLTTQNMFLRPTLRLIGSVRFVSSAVKFEQRQNLLRIQWPSSSSAASKSSDYHFAWLRDHCGCAACIAPMNSDLTMLGIHPSTRQKLHSSGSIDPDIQAKSIKSTPANVLIEWPDGHTSEFGTEWLAANDYSADEVKRRRKSDLTPVHWNASSFDKDAVSIDYRDFMAEDGKLYATLDILRKYGLAILRNVPVLDKQVEQVAGRIGPIRETFYGSSWDVKSVPNAKNIAYTSLFLGFHMDLM
jgi:hypothetical protein